MILIFTYKIKEKTINNSEIIQFNFTCGYPHYSVDVALPKKDINKLEELLEVVYREFDRYIDIQHETYDIDCDMRFSTFEIIRKQILSKYEKFLLRN